MKGFVSIVVKVSCAKVLSELPRPSANAQPFHRHWWLHCKWWPYITTRWRFLRQPKAIGASSVMNPCWFEWPSLQYPKVPFSPDCLKPGGFSTLNKYTVKNVTEYVGQIWLSLHLRNQSGSLDPVHKSSSFKFLKKCHDLWSLVVQPHSLGPHGGAAVATKPQLLGAAMELMWRTQGLQ